MANRLVSSFAHLFRRLSMSRTVWFLLGLGFVLLLIKWWSSDSVQRTSSQLYSNDENYFDATLAKLLKPRWLSSNGHSEVCDFLIKELRLLGFTPIRDEFSDPIPLTNVVGVFNAAARNYLLLSCHYDSKYLEAIDHYVGATDGAVSCALLLSMAKNLHLFLRTELASGTDIGLLLVFFDAHDSLDGITDISNPLIGSKNFVDAETIPLKHIKMVISFNLIGAPNQIYMSKYRRTFKLHERIAKIEEELRISGQLRPCHQLFYKLKDFNNDIDDDHYPFLAKGLPVMHVVPHTYPEVWLQEDDNLTNLHWPTVRNMNVIITRFVYEYLKNYKNETSF